MMRRIGIVAGLPEELDAVHPERMRQDDSRVELDGQTLFLACAGIGKVAAATAAAGLVHRHGVELLLVVGTAGGLGGADGTAYAITEAVQADYGAQRADGLAHYSAGTWPIGPARWDCFRALHIPALDLPEARIATSDLFVECAIHAAGVRDRLGATLIDMETAAVAQVAALLGVPWAAVKATTDAADADSAGSFQANLKRAARAAGQGLERLIALA